MKRLWLAVVLIPLVGCLGGPQPEPPLTGRGPYADAGHGRPPTSHVDPDEDGLANGSDGGASPAPRSDAGGAYATPDAGAPERTSRVDLPRTRCSPGDVRRQAQPPKVKSDVPTSPRDDC